MCWVKVVIFTLILIRYAATDTSVVMELSDEDFEEILINCEHAMVIFYSPSCVHCNQFLPEFTLAADELIRNEPPVHSVKVNCNEGGRSTCEREGVNRLPALKIYKRGTLYDEYDGDRIAQDLIQHIKNLVGITSLELNHRNAGHSFFEGEQGVTIVAFLKKTGQLRDSYFSLPPDLNKDIRFAHYNVEDDSKQVQNKVKLIHPKHMWNRYEPHEYYYTGDGYDLLEFIIKHRHGLVGLRKPRNVDDFGLPLVIVYFVLDLDLRPKMFTYMRNRILPVASKYADRLNFAVSPLHDFIMEFYTFGIETPKTLEPVAFAMLQDNTKYVMPDKFTEENFEAFVESIINGTAEPHLKSQPIPSDEHVHGERVLTAVARNFKQIVLKTDSDILVEFYAPWCSLCQNIRVVLERLAELLIYDNVHIVKMDITTNETPLGFEVTGYPTFYWVPQNEKELPMVYNGGYSLEDLLTFIAKHSTEELVDFDRRGTPKKKHTEL